MKWSLSRIAGFLVGIYLNSFGISMIAKANLGTDPISSPAYVLSLGLPLTFGTITFLVNVLFVVIQIAILGKQFPKFQLLQILVTLYFSVLIDVNSNLIKNMRLEFYWEKFLFLIVGCLIMAFGIALSVEAKIIMTPADALLHTLTRKTGRSFGNLKICFDCTLLVCAVVCSFILFGTCKGVREGTLLTALLAGKIITFYQLCFRRVRNRRIIAEQ